MSGLRVVLTLFHDYTAPASAVAVARLQRLADEGLAVTFVGFEAVGVDARLPVTLDVIGQIDGLAEAAAQEGLVLRRPPFLPATGLAHLVGEVAADADLAASWRQTCYRGFWERGADLSDRDVLRALATDAGLARPQVDAVLADGRELAALRRGMLAYRREGVGGVPVIRAHRTLVPGLLGEAELRALAQL